MSPRRILIINPNTTQAMTDALKPVLSELCGTAIEFEYFTAKTGVPSVNSTDDAIMSAQACWPDLLPTLPAYDAYLVACYSPHPLVPMIRQAMAETTPPKPVIGIFEASIATCIGLLSSNEKFGIVSTGAQWEGILDDGVAVLLGSHASGSPRYAGTATTGLNANQLHDAPGEEITLLMKAATNRLLANGAKAICLGCAGMVGLDLHVRGACVEALGDNAGNSIRIVDGVVSGVLHLQAEMQALAAST